MTCIIIEDEKPAQELLIGFIDKTPFLECQGVFDSGLSVPLDLQKEIDILFLDIMLPGLNGLDFIRSIRNPPHIIVTTAFSDYAVDAFDVEVTDYLLKPFSFERYFKAVSRVRNNSLNNKKGRDDRIFIYADKTHYQIHLDDILFVKAEVDYVRIFTRDNNYLVLDSLRNWSEILGSREFIQIHRSYIVSLGNIIKISGNQLYIQDEIIPIGKNYKKNLMNRIN